MLIVHHLNQSRSQRVLWLLEELGVPYEVKVYLRDKKTMLAPKELKEVHPLGKSPVITDGDVTVAETGAITEYLVNRYGNGRLAPSPESPDRLKYTYFLHYAEGTLMTPLLLALIFGKMNEKSPFFIRPLVGAITGQVTSLFVKPNIDTNVQFLNSELEKRPYFAGNDFSAVDIILSYPIEGLKGRGGELDTKGPRLIEWLNKIKERPAYKVALKKGGTDEAPL